MGSRRTPYLCAIDAPSDRLQRRHSNLPATNIEFHGCIPTAAVSIEFSRFVLTIAPHTKNCFTDSENDTTCRRHVIRSTACFFANESQYSETTDTLLSEKRRKP
jgi:hypothetical protein